jgi:anthranilate phosphoribosyltransferase
MSSSQLMKFIIFQRGCFTPNQIFLERHGNEKMPQGSLAARSDAAQHRLCGGERSGAAAGVAAASAAAALGAAQVGRTWLGWSWLIHW